MSSHGTLDDSTSRLQEHQWFASMAAARALAAQCEALQLLAAQSTDAWLRACAELARLERLRDALGEAMAERDGVRERPARTPAERRMAPAA